jgi:serine/threonine protein kinase
LTAPEIAPGGRLGGYRLCELLGEGGMGLVYRAEREPDGASVALKILRQNLSGDAAYVRRFLREARVAEEVKHRYLVPVLEAGEEGGVYYLAMAYVDGGSLEQRLAKGPLELRECVRVTGQVAAGLDALHAKGLVHRDIKPSNVMLDSSGSAALTDFGLARGASYSTLTTPGRVLGSLAYLAPELIAGEDAGPGSDIYSLGCLVYECLVGQPPFAGRARFEVAVAHMQEEPQDPTERRSDLPKPVGWTVLTALAKEPADRPSTATAYARMLAVAAQS